LTYLFIIESSYTPKLVFFPFPIIGYLVVWVVENALAIHFVLFPLSDILAAFVIVKHSFAMSHIVKFGSLVSASDVGLSHIL